jgi:hypothetical protein
LSSYLLKGDRDDEWKCKWNRWDATANARDHN